MLKNTVKDLAVHTQGYAFSNVDFTDQFSGKQLECSRLIQRTYWDISIYWDIKKRRWMKVI